jgi:polysaccharide deacetylase family protein (PEP-CTERM system associated)
MSFPIRPTTQRVSEYYFRIKRWGEAAVALVLLILTLPLITVGALLIKLTSPGPIFYTQTRLGKDGRAFTLWKLRTMVRGAEDHTGPVWAEEHDPRITLVGRVLRRTHLDELPQLVNVLRGEMSLVGPRPERPVFVTRLNGYLPAYRQRQCVRPGLTGLAQLHLPPDSDIKDVEHKLAYDLYYIRHANPWLDFRILLFTLGRLIARTLQPFWNLITLPGPHSVAKEFKQLTCEGTRPCGEEENGRTRQLAPPLAPAVPSATSSPSGDHPPDLPLNALTVDVEDYFHVQAFADRIRPSDWDQFPARVETNTRRILSILEDHQVQATFFILGWVADRFPHLVREIDEAGHEIGCHSFWHQLIYRQTPDAFREDLLQASKCIEEIVSKPVRAFRAPCFSITEQSLWALDILAEEGYRYDSSIFPIYHDHYGIPAAERFPHALERAAGTLLEFPPSVSRIYRMNVPVAGGGYFRLAPEQLLRRFLQGINRHEGQPFMFYIHPWELDPEQPRLPARWRSRFRHYQNLHSSEAKLRNLVSSFRFGTMSQALAEIAPPTAVWEGCSGTPRSNRRTPF